MFDQQRPYSAEAEQSVIGSCLVSADAAEKAADALTGSDFYSLPDREVFRAISEIVTGGGTPDIVTVSERMTANNTLEVAGGAAYLAKAARSVPSALNVEAYIDILKEHSMRRAAIDAAEAIMQDAQNRSISPNEIAARAAQTVLSMSGADGLGLRDMSCAMLSAFAQIEEAHRMGGKPTGIPTGIPTLDKITNGLQRGDLIILAARPSMGKSALASSIAYHAAAHYKKPVAMFSLEMPDEQIAQRLLSAETLIDADKLRRGDLTADEFRRAMSSMDRMGKHPLYIDATAAVTASHIRSQCKKLQARSGLGLIVVDYLQLMTSELKTRDYNQQVAINFISRSLKGIAKDFNVPVLALSQLSRAPDARADHVPVMSDLRDSGAIEQDADIILFLYRAWIYDKSKDKNRANLFVAKNRNGSLGAIDLFWNDRNVLFTELDTRTEAGHD